jgi:hypothetical protein
MANSYLNIITFLLTTLFYYLALKPALPYSLYANKEEYKNYIANNYMFLAIYVLLVILIQFIVNSSIIANTCGGNITENMGAAGILTFLPWIFIFGIIVIVLTIYPGFKSAFSDVIGYYYVSNEANKILTELLINKELETKLKEDTAITAEKKASLENTADVIMKICGNTSILINQIVPSNFDQYWSILRPLMKDKYQTSSEETNKIKNDLFELVVTRDNVGESMWYIYTGLLLTSIVQLKITSRGCSTNPKTMQSNYEKFLEEENKAKEQKEKASTTYTITN